MPPRYLAFDIETARDFPGEFSDWRRYRPLGISCAATVASDAGLCRPGRVHDLADRPGWRQTSPAGLDHPERLTKNAASDERMADRPGSTTPAGA